MENMFSGCTSLRELDLNFFNTSNWPVKTIYGLARDCASLEEFDISSWDVSLFVVSDTRYMVSGAFGLQTISLPLGLFQNSSNVSGNLSDCKRLVDVNGFRMYFNHTYANCLRLTRQSLRNIVSDLPTVSAARTLTLGQTNRLKLTPEEIAVATQKGWTVA